MDKGSLSSSFRSVQILTKAKQTLAHTARKSGWIFPGPHILAHHSFSEAEANVINVMAQNVGSVLKSTTFDNEAYANVGDFFYAGSIPHRIYEPLVSLFIDVVEMPLFSNFSKFSFADSQVIYHYIQRDLDNCASKLARESQIHPADWRVVAGVAGCTGDEQYQSHEVMTPLFEPGSFYAAATKDTTMAKSYYGTHLPDLLGALREIVQEYREGRMANLGPPVTRVEEIPDILYQKGV